jgi:hypothetical protein
MKNSLENWGSGTNGDTDDEKLHRFSVSVSSAVFRRREYHKNL